MSESNLVALIEPLFFNDIREEGCLKTIIYNDNKMTVNMCKIIGYCKH